MCLETTGIGTISTQGCGELACSDASAATTYICVPPGMQWCGTGTSNEYAAGCVASMVAVSNLGCELPTSDGGTVPDQCFWYGADCSPWCDPGHSVLDASPGQTGCYLPEGGFYSGG
jgi:hypothetical protein